MKVDKKKFNLETKNFDEKSDYYIATRPSNKDIKIITNKLSEIDELLSKNNLKKRSGDYLHMTQIYLPAINKINNVLKSINGNAELKKEKLVDYIEKILSKNYPIEKYVIDEVGWFGHRSVSLRAIRKNPPIYIDSFIGFKKLILDSGLNENEFKEFINTGEFTLLEYYKGQKYLPHISIASVSKNKSVSKEVLNKLTEIFKGMEITLDKCELRKNPKPLKYDKL